LSLTLSGSLGAPLLLAALGWRGFELGFVLSSNLCHPPLLKTKGLSGFELGLVPSRSLYAARLGRALLNSLLPRLQRGHPLLLLHLPRLYRLALQGVELSQLLRV